MACSLFCSFWSKKAKAIWPRALGGGAQTLFGGSGGQDIFQKITWVLGGIFMAGSLGLSIIKSKGTSFGDYMSTQSHRYQCSTVQQRPSGTTRSSNKLLLRKFLQEIPSPDNNHVAYDYTTGRVCGSYAINMCLGVGKFSLFLFESIRVACTTRPKYAQIVDQMYRIGVSL